jgi:hypothetical protein
MTIPARLRHGWRLVVLAGYAALWRSTTASLARSVERLSYHPLLVPPSLNPSPRRRSRSGPEIVSDIVEEVASLPVEIAVRWKASTPA